MTSKQLHHRRVIPSAVKAHKNLIAGAFDQLSGSSTKESLLQPLLTAYVASGRDLRRDTGRRPRKGPQESLSFRALLSLSSFRSLVSFSFSSQKDPSSLEEIAAQ